MGLTQEILKDLIEYCPEQGKFWWKVRDKKYFSGNVEHGYRCWNSANAGKEAGHRYTNKRGYVQIQLRIFGRLYPAARVAYLYVTGFWPEGEIDHIDGDGTNNRWENLRDVDRQTNALNRKISSRSTTGYSGVYKHKHCNGWYVRIGFNGEPIYGGSFKNKEDAINKAREMYNELGFTERHGVKEND